MYQFVKSHGHSTILKSVLLHEMLQLTLLLDSVKEDWFKEYMELPVDATIYNKLKKLQKDKALNTNGLIGESGILETL